MLQVHTFKTYDTSGERKDAANLLAKMREVIDLAEKTWNVTVIAVTTDCGGDARGARARLGRERRDLVLPDCHGHQVSIFTCFEHHGHLPFLHIDQSYCWGLL